MKRIFIYVLIFIFAIPRNSISQGSTGFGNNNSNWNQNQRDAAWEDQQRRNSKNSGSIGDDLLIGGVIFGLGALIFASSNSKNTAQSTQSVKSYPRYYKESVYTPKAVVFEGGLNLLKNSLNDNWERKGRRVSGDLGLSVALTPIFWRSRIYGRWFYSSRGHLFESNNEDFFINPLLINQPKLPEYPLFEDGNIELRNQFMGTGLIYRFTISDTFFGDIGSGFIFNQRSKVVFHNTDLQDENKKFRYIGNSEQFESNVIKTEVLNFEEDIKSRIFYEVGIGFGKKDVFGRLYTRAYHISATSGTNYPLLNHSAFFLDKKLFLELNFGLGFNLTSK